MLIISYLIHLRHQAWKGDLTLRDKDIMRKFICLSQLHRKVAEKRVEGTGVHQAQHHLLMCLAENEFGSQVELAKKMRVTPATVAVSLKVLERDGYIYREAKATDSRFNNIKLTEKGQTVVDESRHIFDEIDKAAFYGITQEEKKHLSEVLDKLYENLVKVREEI